MDTADVWDRVRRVEAAVRAARDGLTDPADALEPVGRLTQTLCGLPGEAAGLPFYAHHDAGPSWHLRAWDLYAAVRDWVEVSRPDRVRLRRAVKRLGPLFEAARAAELCC